MDKRCFNKIGFSENNDFIGPIGSGNRLVVVKLEENITGDLFDERYCFWMNKLGMKYTDFRLFLDKYWKENNVSFPLEFKGAV